MRPSSQEGLLGEGDFTYLPRDWGFLPEGFRIGDVGGIAIDHTDQVYVFHRGPHPVMVFDRAGELLRFWGDGIFRRPHAISIGNDGMVWCTDDGDHTVRKFTPSGRLLMQLGVPGQPAAPMSGAPFHRCTHTAESASGDIYVSDGYGNARIHKFSGDGRLLKSWGEPGIGPGEFNVPHNLLCDGDGRIYVADRENHRLQVFDGDGNFEAEWHHLHRPCALCAARGAQGVFYVGEAGPGMAVNRSFPNLGPRLSVVDRNGKVLARVGQLGAGDSLGQFVAPHGIAVDSRGDLYVGEVAHTAWPSFSDAPPPATLRTLRKLVRQRNEIP